MCTVAVSPSECEAAVAAMAAADPDLDPVWGLLVDAADAEESEDNCVSLTHSVHACATPVESAASACASTAEPAVMSDDDEDSADEQNGGYTATGQSAPEAPKRGDVVDKVQVPPEKFQLPEDVGSSVTRWVPPDWEVPGCDGFVLDGVLTQAECDSLISQGEDLWSFWDNSCENPRVEFRNAHTVEVMHNALADRIWQRVQPFVVPNVSIVEEDERRFEVDIEGEWEPYAVNPTLLLARYLNGGHFSPHTDGTTIVDFNRRTFYSCIVYLNSSPSGGETRIYSDHQIRRDLQPDEEGRLTGDPSLILGAVPPAPGRMLLFYHRVMHEGVPAAEKYIIRTDILYRRNPELCTAPEDVEAFDMYREAELLAEQGHCEASVSLFRRAFKRSPALAKVYKM